MRLLINQFRDMLFAYIMYRMGDDRMDNFITNKKLLANLLKEARNIAKPDKCILCGIPQTSFCNSHSVPQMVLKTIADNGKMLYANSLIGMELIDLEKGINNAGTFHFICNSCDGKTFQDYEDSNNLHNYPSDLMMAEIALKDMLMMISKRNEEKALFTVTQNRTNGIINKEVLDEIKDTDKKEYLNELFLYKQIIKEKTTGCFQILVWEKLPYITPIATQTPICIYKDLEGNIINDIYSDNIECRMQNLHLCVFPIENETIVLLFHHKRDKNYRKLRHQLNCLSFEKRLMYINYLIFSYTENYFISKKIKEQVETDKNLSKLSKEANELPNFGLLEWTDFFVKYEPVSMENIPNFLAKEYCL